MTRLLPILLALHLTSPVPIVDAPVQEDYRVEVLQARVERLVRWERLAKQKGWHQDADGNCWR